MKKSVFFLILLFIAACRPSGVGGPADITGSEGLTISLGNIPRELVHGQSAIIPVIIENAGATDVENAIMTLTGPSENVIRLATNRIESIKLAGRTEFVQRGERTVETFSIDSVNIPNERERVAPFQVTLCYPYKTKASPVVCINPQLAQGAVAVPSGCDFTTAQLAPTQGAPIAVSNVETTYLGKNQIQFNIYISDVSGKGSLVAPGAYTKRCGNEPITQTDQDVVSFEAFLSGEKLNCYTSGDKTVEKIKITDGFVRCIATYSANQPAFTTVLSVQLSYGYSVSEVFSINLRNPAFAGQS
jgi:uncharacterized membrane protein